MTGAILPPDAVTPLPQLPGKQVPLCWSALASGALAAISVSEEIGGHPAIKGDNASAALFSAWAAKARTAEASLWIFDGVSPPVRQLTLPLETPFPVVDRFPDGRWLVVGARGVDDNARVLNSSGALLSRFRLGDGVEQVKIDALGRIWVGWFDEGVGCNEDWVVAGLDWPPSHGAVACFDDTGAFVWGPDLMKGAHPFDCESLNVADDIGWLKSGGDLHCFDGRDGHELWPINEHWYMHAMACDGERILSIGLNPDLNLEAAASGATLLRLGEKGGVETVGSWSLGLPPVRADWVLDGRGDEVHLIADGVWRRWSLSRAAP